MKLKIGLAQNILYQFNIFCTGTKTNCTKVQIELQHRQISYERTNGPFKETYSETF